MENHTNNIYPLFFSLERVRNGYILTYKDISEGGRFEAKFRKEIVTDERINSRIGELLCLKCLNPDTPPVVFHVEMLHDKNYNLEEVSSSTNKTLEAKLAYVNFHLPKQSVDKEETLIFHYKDDNTIEIYGNVAIEISRKLSIEEHLTKIGGIPILSMPYNEDNLRNLRENIGKIKMTEWSKTSIEKWYDSRKVIMNTSKEVSQSK